MTDLRAKVKLKTADDESINDVYEEMIPQLQKGYRVNECRKIGYALFCFPCPFHQQNNDALIIDPRDSRFLKCTREPFADREIEHITLDHYNILKQITKKVKQNEISSTRAEIVERYYVSNNIIISINTNDNEGYKAYRYIPEEGIYKELSPGTIKSETQLIYEKLFGEKPAITLLSEMKNKVYTLTVRPEDENIFSPIKGEIYYLPGRKRDIKINKETGEVQILDKDPVSRPFLSRMQYDFAIDPPESMPKEFEIFRKYTTPKFFDNIKVMLAKAVLLKGLDYIFINYSRRHGAGKTTLYDIFEDLFGDIVIRAKVKDFYYQFFEEKLVGKTLLLLEEYKGYSEKVNEDLKAFSSVRGKIEGERKFKEKKAKSPNTLSVIINMNRFQFSQESLKDQAFKDRIIITPFTHKWSEDEYPKWSKEEREEIFLYIVTKILPDVIKGKLKPVTYPFRVVMDWIERFDGIPPDGVDIFLRENAYDQMNEKNTRGVFVPLKKAYIYYQMWCDMNDYLPVMDSEFEDLMYYANNVNYLVEKDGEKGIYMKKANLTFYL